MVRFTKIQSKHKERISAVSFSNADFNLTVLFKIMIHLKSVTTYLVSVGTILRIFVVQGILNIARDTCLSI